jgi:hypothetical protein
MQEVTFAFDVQLNDNEDWIKEGTKVSIYDHPLKKTDAVPVIITKYWNFEGKELEQSPNYEWFMVRSFKEFNK